MALPITDSQGTLVYLVDTATSTADATAIATAIAGGDQIGCLQDLGSIATSRNVQEYSCLSSDEVAKSLGAITLPNISMSLLFDAADAAGQSVLRTMYNANTRKKMIIVLNDDLGANPTYIVFEAGVSSHGVNIAKDNAVMVDVTVELCSNPITTLASAV